MSRPDFETAAQIAREVHTRTLGVKLYTLAETAEANRTGNRGGSHFPPLTAITAGWLAALFSDHTRTAYRRDIHRWFAWCHQRRVNPAEADPGHFALYAHWLAQQVPNPRSPGKNKPRYTDATRARYLSAVGSFYDFAEDQDEIIGNPTTGVIRGGPPRVRRRVLTAAEQDALWHAVTDGWPHDRLDGLTLAAAVALGLDLAWRPGQMYAARIQDLTLIPGGAAGITTTVRGTHRTTDELTPRARDAIAQLLINGRGYSSAVYTLATTYPGYSAPLLTAKINRPMGRTWLAHQVDVACDVAGITPGTGPDDRITPAVLRRTALTPATEPKPEEPADDHHP